jgi:uncharacterized protein YcbX
MTATPKIVLLVRYPVKGLAGMTLGQATLAEGEGMPLDRAYAIENGSHSFESHNPKWLPKTHFLQLMRHERLASLEPSFDEDTHTLTLSRTGKQLAKGALKTKLGRQMIEQFLSAYFKAELKGPPRIVCAGGHHFTDIAAKALHLVNLETVRDIGRITGLDLDPLRFRANVYFEGAPAWQERGWLGKTIACGGARLSVFSETGRCEATSVDPATAQRGLSLPSALERTWSHRMVGLYASVIGGGLIEPGDAIAIE